MNEKIKILIIEDDPLIADFLKTGLQYEGYAVTVAGRGKEGIAILQNNVFQLLILDVMLPDTDGFILCRQLREKGQTLPILMLTVRNEVSDRIKGLDSGADDYLTKPFVFDELLARIRALLRRQGKTSPVPELVAGDIRLNTETREVQIKNEFVDLTPTEFALLALFMQYPHRVFTRETLLNRVLGYDYEGNSNIIDVHVNHLRKKMNDGTARLIRTVYGVGYAFYPRQHD